jgi:hypothetical protein
MSDGKDIPEEKSDSELIEEVLEQVVDNEKSELPEAAEVDAELVSDNDDAEQEADSVSIEELTKTIKASGKKGGRKLGQGCANTG